MTSRRLRVNAIVVVVVALICALAVTVPHAVAQGLAIDGAGPIALTAGDRWSQTIGVNGGTPPYSWTVSGSAASLATLSSTSGNTVVLTVIPNESGSFSFTLSVTDSSVPPRSEMVAIPIAVAPRPSGVVITTPSSLPTATQGSSFNQTLTARGGTSPYVWSVDGALPSGITLAANTGVLSGIPTAAGSFSFTVTVSDSTAPAPMTATTVLTLAVAAARGLMVTSPLPLAIQDQPYSHALTVSGGTAPYTWSTANGALPTGITLVPGTGVLSGTPTASGTFSFTVRVTDASAVLMATKSLTLAVSSFAITSPLPRMRVGLPYNQALTASGGTPPYAWSVINGPLPSGVTLSADSGALSGTPNMSGNFSFTIKVTDSSAPVPLNATERFELAVD